MKTVYLKNGTAVLLHEELPGGRYLVEPIYRYDGQEGEYEAGCGQQEIVSEIFDKAPIELIDAEYAMAEEKLCKSRDEILHLGSEIYRLNRQIEQTQKTIVNNEKFIINKTELLNAEELVLFEQGRVMPLIKHEKIDGLKVHFEISLRENKQSSWGYKFYPESGWSGSQYLDQEQGIMVDPTIEEIDERIKYRLATQTFSDREIDTTHDKYLTPAQIQGKRARKAQQVAKDISAKEQVIKEAQDAIAKLRGETGEVTRKYDPVKACNEALERWAKGEE